MVILYIYSTCWHMKSMFYERQQLDAALSVTKFFATYSNSLPLLVVNLTAFLA
jgi:hypothetical protein